MNQFKRNPTFKPPHPVADTRTQYAPLRTKTEDAEKRAPLPSPSSRGRPLAVSEAAATSYGRRRSSSTNQMEHANPRDRRTKVSHTDLVAATLRCRYEAATRKPQDVGGAPPSRSVVAAYLTNIKVRSADTRPPARARTGAFGPSMFVSNAATTLRRGGNPTPSGDSLVAATVALPLRTPSRSGKGVAA